MDHFNHAFSTTMGFADRLAFEIDPAHFARQILLDEEPAALASLARRCVDYLRLASERFVPPAAAPGMLRQMLKPRHVPLERSFVLGIYARNLSRPAGPDQLRGVLYFLHPPAGSFTWYLTLLLLEPGARGHGLGTAVHRAFARWAAARGSRRIVVAVARNNPRALRFWRDRMGYGNAPGAGTSPCLTKPDNQNLERYLEPVPAWSR